MCGSPRGESGWWPALFSARGTVQGTGMLHKAQTSGMFYRGVVGREGFPEEAGALRDGEELECRPSSSVYHSWSEPGGGPAHPELGAIRSLMGLDPESSRESLLAFELESVLAESSRIWSAGLGNQQPN